MLAVAGPRLRLCAWIGAASDRRSDAPDSFTPLYVYIQLPGTLETVPAALLRVQTLPDGTQIGRFRYGDRYLQRPEAVALDPFQLPLAKEVFEFTRLNGIPGAVRDAGPDAWGRRVIEHKVERSAADLQEIDYLLHGPQDGAGYLSFGLKAEPPAPTRQYNRTHQLDPGTSMGGARPKATIEDAQSLWLANMPFEPILSEGVDENIISRVML